MPNTVSICKQEYRMCCGQNKFCSLYIFLSCVLPVRVSVLRPSKVPGSRETPRKSRTAWNFCSSDSDETDNYMWSGAGAKSCCVVRIYVRTHRTAYWRNAEVFALKLSFIVKPYARANVVSSFVDLAQTNRICWRPGLLKWPTAHNWWCERHAERHVEKTAI